MQENLRHATKICHPRIAVVHLRQFSAPSGPPSILRTEPPVNERTTATPVSATTSPGDATAGEPSYLCDWWPWLHVIALGRRSWYDRTPLPRPAVSTDTS
jgi:hypothetical protein